MASDIGKSILLYECIGLKLKQQWGGRYAMIADCGFAKAMLEKLNVAITQEDDEK